ncbi:hypothetical protein IPL68_06280 [Candidatus Saccharibacteria bacterium]|nr:MAG: hypothetical protein IPL68_06280 [Candidatus Saccharibacteria bacterium]
MQCYGPAAAAYTKNRIGSQRIRLVADTLTTNRDRYDRLLRYVVLKKALISTKNWSRKATPLPMPFRSQKARSSTWPWNKHKKPRSASGATASRTNYRPASGKAATNCSNVIQ